MKHPLFFARTVLVQNNDVDKAVRTLNRILGREGVISDYRRIQRYEKPWQVSRAKMILILHLSVGFICYNFICFIYFRQGDELILNTARPFTMKT